MQNKKKMKFRWKDGRLTYLWPDWPLVIAGGPELAIVIEQIEAGAPIEHVAATVSERFHLPVTDVLPSVQNIADTLAGMTINTPEESPDNSLAMATLNMTRSCNLRCRHCYIGMMDQGMVVSSDTEWTVKGLQAAVATLGKVIIRPPRLLILSGGEPTLVPAKVKVAVETARQYGLSPRLNTNGVGLTENLAAFLVDNEVLVQVSIDGVDANTHNLLRGQGNSYYMARVAVERLVKRGGRVRISCTTHQANVDQIPAMIRLSQELGAEQFITSNLVIIGRAACSNLKPVSFEQEFSILYHTVKDNPLWQKMTRSTLLAETINAMRGGIRFTYCGTGCSTACIDSDGKIYPCINLVRPDYCAGDLSQGQDDLETVWKTSPILKGLRTLNIETMNEKCSRCPFKFFCGGYCRGETLCAGGSLTDPYARCREWQKGLLKVLDLISATPDLYLFEDGETTGGFHRE